jgi:hypothetical protein
MIRVFGSHECAIFFLLELQTGSVNTTKTRRRMRQIIVPNQMLEVGSVEWGLQGGDPEIPVVTNADAEELLGMARDIQNEPDGGISAEIIWFDSKRATYATTVYLDSVTYTIDDATGFILVHSGNLRHIFIAEGVLWGETGKLPEPERDFRTHPMLEHEL